METEAEKYKEVQWFLSNHVSEVWLQELEQSY